MIRIWKETAMLTMILGTGNLQEDVMGAFRWKEQRPMSHIFGEPLIFNLCTIRSLITKLLGVFIAAPQTRGISS